MGNHDPTTSMFHCLVNATFHINSSSAVLLIYTLPSLLCKRNFDPSLKMAWDHCSALQPLWVRANSRRAFLCRDVRRGFFLGLRPIYPASLSLLRVLEIDTLTSCSSLYFWSSLIAIIHAFSDHGSVFSPRCLSLSSWNVEVFHTSCRFLFFKISHTLLWLQPTWTAITRCE